MITSGAEQLKAASAVSYSDYCRTPVDRGSVVQVLKDLPRTFPEHPRLGVSSDPGLDGSDQLVPLELDAAALAKLESELRQLDFPALEARAVAMGVHSSTREMEGNTAAELIEMTLTVAQDSLLGKLERILLALVARSPSVGYTQGMNYVVGILLFDVRSAMASHA